MIDGINSGEYAARKQEEEMHRQRVRNALAMAAWFIIMASAAAAAIATAYMAVRS